MVATPQFRIPSPTALSGYQSPFTPARIDFSKIGELADRYYQAQDDAAKRQAAQEDRAHTISERQRLGQVRQTFAGGIPKDAQGNVDISALADEMIRLGEVDQAKNFYSLAGQEADRVHGRTHRDRTFEAEQAYRQQTLALQREKLQRSHDLGTRQQMLIQNGIDPNSVEGKAYMLTGKLPGAAYQNLAQDQRKARTAPNIASGLGNLNRMTTDYDDTAFESALGPFQGSTPDGLVSSIPINIARGIGEAWNFVWGGNATPNEVRNNVTGATEALAAAIKPLIRAPGEGVWTDQDQARLVSIVGDLPQARTKEEFKRRLNAVRNRIQANFGLEIPFDALATGAPQQAEPAAPPPAPGAIMDGYRFKGGNPADPNSWEKL